MEIHETDLQHICTKKHESEPKQCRYRLQHNNLLTNYQSFNTKKLVEYKQFYQQIPQTYRSIQYTYRPQKKFIAIVNENEKINKIIIESETSTIHSNILENSIPEITTTDSKVYINEHRDVLNLIYT